MRRTNETIWLLVWLLLAVASGCTETEVEDGDIPPHALKEVEAGFNLSVLANRTSVTRSITFTPTGTFESDTLVTGMNDTLQTRAAGALTTDQENRIASLWVGQYNATTGKHLFNQFFESMTGTTVNLKLKQIPEESNSHVYFISNAGNLGEIADEATLKTHTLPYTSTDEGLPNDNLCRMVGMWDGKVVAGGMTDIEVEMTRLLAKITFTYSMGADFSFTPTSVALRSVPDKSQVTAPATQLSGLNYGTYSGTASADGATIYWYLPENMAGTVSGFEAVDSEKKKIGTGVTNATCIELTGTAVQGDVTYEEVTFRFYPGSDMNNYDIIRNSHYAMNVTLVGIDVSDERITVGKIPPIIVDEGNMPAEKGGIKEVQITARPGQPWSFDMPQWLSALLDGTAVSAGATFSYHGPYKVAFQAASANPKAEDRSVTFTLKVNGIDQDLTITQSGSTLTKGEDISLEAAFDSEGTSSFTATKGLPWSIALSDGEWLDWATGNSDILGDEALAEAQTLAVKAKTSNPSATARTGKITIKAGASVGDVDYTGLKQEIDVTQAGSTVTGSSKEVNAEAVNGLTSTSTATAGLNWAASVTDGSWITLAESSGSPTTGSAQDIIYNVPVNPDAEPRRDEITVRVGDASTGPTAIIEVKQKPSALTVSASPTTLAATKDAAGTLSFKGTSGLPFSVTMPDWLTLTGTIPETTNGNDQNLGYKTNGVNLNSTERTATVMVKVGNISKEVTISQAGSIFDVNGGIGTIAIAASGGTTISSVAATDGLAWTISPATDNGISVNPTNGSGDARLEFSANENNVAKRTGTFIVTVTDSDPLRTFTVTVTQARKNIPVCIENLQIQKSDPGTIAFADVASFCEGLDEENHDDWRLPTKDELVIIYNNLASLEEYVEVGFVMLNGGVKDKWFWSSDFSKTNRYVVNMITGRVTSSSGPTGGGYIRCVRDL